MANYTSTHTGAEIDSAVGRTKDTVVTAGTVAASSAVVVDANKDISGFRNVTLTGQIQAATINLTGDTTIGDGDTDNITINADVNSNIIPNTDNTFDLGSASKQWKDIYVNGIGYIDQLGTDADPIAIYASSGEIDGTAIGSESASTGAFTTLTASGDVNFDSNTLFVDASQNGVSVGSADPLGYGLNIESSNALRIKGADSSSNYHIRVLDSASNVDFVVRGDGNVGVGLASPSAGAVGGKVLHIQNSGATASVRVDRSDASTAGTLSITSGNTSNSLFSTGSKNLTISTNSSTAMTIDSSQRVGIGVTSPTTKLHLSDGTNTAVIAKFTNDTTGNTINDGSSIGIDGDGDLLIYNVENKEIKFYTNDTQRAVIDNGGKVGIGVASPESLLHIQGASATAVGARLTLDNNVGSSLNNAVEIAMLTDSGASVAGVSNARIKAINTNASNGAAAITFTTWSGSSEGERMRISSDGNVGINQTSADAKLHIKGDAKIVNIESTSATGRCYIMFEDPSSDKGFIGYGSSQNDTLAVYNYKNNGLQFGAGGAEVMSIDTSGNVTPTGSLYMAGSSTGRLHFNNHRALEGATNASLLRIGEDYTSTTIYGNVGIGTTSPVGKLELNNGTSDVELQFKETSTAYHRMGVKKIGSQLQLGEYNNDGDTITPILTIDGNGDNVGIGETNPTTKLFVKDESATPVNIRRAASDGDVINFQRGATGVAAIQINSSSASFRNYSDRRLKKDFTSMNEVLEKINSINLYSYKLKIDESSSYGATAQELNDIFPELVKTTDDGTGTEIPENTEAWSISSDMNWILIKAIQELSAKVEALENA